MTALGHEVIACRATPEGQVQIRQALKELGKRGITSLLVEGGGRIYAELVSRKLVDRFVIGIAPKLVGGKGLDFLPGIGVSRMNDALVLTDVVLKTFGDNVVFLGTPRWR
jgi:diaminohydroxyphosphoribosylaminopyrimidine deaminase/5-amino-6-(5-phosphoribosylamino)uracil reductase